MMDPAFKAKWLEALRSGRYRQGQGHLHIADDFCCLGVACDISGHGEWHAGNFEPEFFYFTVPEEACCYSAYLPRTLCVRLGVTTEDMFELTRLNDSGRSFAEIADWIGANL